jgi:hypothetical protein
VSNERKVGDVFMEDGKIWRVTHVVPSTRTQRGSGKSVPMPGHFSVVEVQPATPPHETTSIPMTFWVFKQPSGGYEGGEGDSRLMRNVLDADRYRTRPKEAPAGCKVMRISVYEEEA